MAYVPASAKEYKPASTGHKSPYIAPDLQALVDKVGQEHSPMAEEEAKPIDWVEVRKIRNQKLNDTDWVNQGARLLTYEERQELYRYRQELRDMTKQSTLVWPIEPEILKKRG